MYLVKGLIMFGHDTVGLKTCVYAAVYRRSGTVDVHFNIIDKRRRPINCLIYF